MFYQCLTIAITACEECMQGLEISVFYHNILINNLTETVYILISANENIYHNF